MEWISVEERLPELDLPALVYHTKGYTHPVKAAQLRMRGRNAPNWYVWAGPSTGLGMAGVTHWMPLPPPPTR